MSTINLGINVVGNIVLIPFLGAVACGIMLIVTETIGVLASQWRLRRHGVLPLPFGYLLRLVPAGLLALGAIYLTYDPPLIVLMAAGGLAYVIGALLVGAIPENMRAALLGALRPKSLDRIEADATAATEGASSEAVPSRPALDAETGALTSTRSPNGNGNGHGHGQNGVDAPTVTRRPAYEDSLDLQTMEMDLAALQNARIRSTPGKYVEMRMRP